MYFTNLLLTLLALTTALGSAALTNSTREYKLRTCLKPGQPFNPSFESLYLSTYHTGAGLSDAVFYSTNYSNGITGFLNASGPPVPTTSTGVQNDYQVFDLGNPFPWAMILQPVTYLEWAEVRINAAGAEGPDYGGFFINDTGLQWTSILTNPGSADDAFGGWLVCDWWHGVAQLFFRINGFNYTLLPSCADVYLEPMYT